MLASLRGPDGGKYYDSEIARLEGEMRRRLAPHAPEDAARCFERALELARRWDAKSFELRAATSLARLWRDQSRREDARRALAGVYGWFTEGFDTQDLRSAKVLLDELAT
jgi:predicted ATPase